MVALDTFSIAEESLPGSLLQKVFYFHDIRVCCQTNSPALFELLAGMLGAFPAPAKLQGEVSYSVLCYDNASKFPVQLPPQRKRVETIRLLTGTKLKYYRSSDEATEYQSYASLQSINGEVLSIIKASQHSALTQLEKLDRYSGEFLRRYVMLLALGQLVRPYGFEPCHAAAITAPSDSQQGALIVGASESGKTTLSLGCANSGYGLLGDDLVMLRENPLDKVIQAYAITQEVSVRSGTLALWKNLSFLQTLPADSRDKRYCNIEHIRSGATRLQTPLRLLFFPMLTGKKTSRVVPLSKAAVLQALVEQCMSKSHTSAHGQEKLFSMLSTLADQAPGYRLVIARGTREGPAMLRTLFKESFHEE